MKDMATLWLKMGLVVLLTTLTPGCSKKATESVKVDSLISVRERYVALPSSTYVALPKVPGGKLMIKAGRSRVRISVDSNEVRAVVITDSVESTKDSTYTSSKEVQKTTKKHNYQRVILIVAFFLVALVVIGRFFYWLIHS